MSAIFFGSISTLADTSELQRRAFNEAFQAHGLNWNWSQDDYSSMLDSNGGRDRIADFAAQRGQEVDAAEVHTTKSAIFQELLSSSTVAPRPGVVDAIRRAKDEGVQLGFVTTTSRENVSALLDALSPEISHDTFDVVVDASTVGEPKPDPAAYRHALQRLGEDSGHVVAIEDNKGGLQAAGAAGIRCIAFPNQNTAGSDFTGAAQTVETLDADALLAHIAS